MLMINKYFDLEIVSSSSNDAFVIEWIEVYGLGGSFLVGPDHSPLVSIVAGGSNLIYRKRDSSFNQEIPASSGGIFKVENNKAIVLLDS